MALLRQAHGSPLAVAVGAQSGSRRIGRRTRRATARRRGRLRSLPHAERRGGGARDDPGTARGGRSRAPTGTRATSGWPIVRSRSRSPTGWPSTRWWPTRFERRCANATRSGRGPSVERSPISSTSAPSPGSSRCRPTSSISSSIPRFGGASRRHRQPVPHRHGSRRRHRVHRVVAARRRPRRVVGR